MSRRRDLTGKAYDRLTVIGMAYRDRFGNAHWLCECECGNEVVIRGSNLNAGRSRSCGCLNLERLTSHGHRTTKPTRTYKSWISMKERCLNPKNPGFVYYGERGIQVCKRWLDSFENFLEDMGERPPDTSIDRINVDGSYEPSNCRWADAVTQANNKRRNKKNYLVAMRVGD